MEFLRRFYIFAFILFNFLYPDPVKAELDKLVIYTYSSFSAEYGAGPTIQKNFETLCHCTIEWVTADDGGALLSRLQLEKEKSRADIVLGLDNNLMEEARKLDLFVPHGVDQSALLLPVSWQDETFLPFDLGYFAFVYDTQKISRPPQSLEALIDGPEDQKILIEDPRSSTPGLGLLLWIKTIYGDKAASIWAKLKPKILTVSKGWDEAYELFTKGEAPIVFSYSTDTAYHKIVDKNDRYKAAIFPEGHYLQIELAALTKRGSANPLARQFMQFILTPDFQKAIPQGNWVYPAIDLKDALPQIFRDIPKPQKALMLDPVQVGNQRKDWIHEWLQVMAF